TNQTSAFLEDSDGVDSAQAAFADGSSERDVVRVARSARRSRARPVDARYTSAAAYTRLVDKAMPAAPSHRIRSASSTRLSVRLIAVPAISARFAFNAEMRRTYRIPRQKNGTWRR